MRRPPTIYLAGPILDCEDGDVNEWRTNVMDSLPACGFLNPMRRDYRGVQDEHVIEIVEEDKQDILASDIVLAFCWQASWGTAMEIHYGWDEDKTILSVIPPELTVSPWVAYHSTATFRSLGHAVEWIKKKHDL